METKSEAVWIAMFSFAVICLLFVLLIPVGYAAHWALTLFVTVWNL